MARRIIAASIGYIDNESPQASQTLYVATEAFTTGSGDTPANTFFNGRLSGNIDFEFRVAAPYTGRKPVSGFGALRISNADGFLDDALNWQFRDQDVVVKSLEVGQSWAAGTVLATSVADRLEMVGLDTMVIHLRDPAALLERPIQQSAWQGTGGQFDDAAGKLKPVAFGTPLNVKPVPVNFDINRWDCSDGEITDVDAVRINGLEVQSYQVVGGINSSGITLDAPPEGELTIDPIATGTGSVIGMVVDSPPAAGITYSNLDRTVQNTRRVSDSPLLYNHNNLSSTGRALADGGKWYFELVPNRVVQASANYESAFGTYMGVGGGLAPAAIAANAYIDGADVYAIACDALTSQGTRRAETYRDTVTVDALQSTTITSWNAGNIVIGVECDFDALQVTFKVYEGGSLAWTSTALTITSNSPLDTLQPFASVAANGAADLRGQDNKITVYTQPEKFALEVPAGFTAWDTSAFTDSTQFSALVGSITDRIPGITVDTTTQAEIDALGYSYSYYAANSEPAAQILWEACRGFTGWYYINRNGALAFGFLDEPTGTPDATFTDAEIISVRKVEIDYARGLSNRMGARRNWTVLSRATLDSALSEADKDLLSRKYRFEVTDETAIAEAYAHARQAQITDTLFREDANATDEAARLMGIFVEQNRLMEVDVAFDVDQYASLDLGSTVLFELDRYGLSEAVDGQYLVLGMKGSFSSPTMRLLVWGGRAESGEAAVCKINNISGWGDYWQYSGDIFSVTAARVGIHVYTSGRIRAFENEDTGSGFGSPTFLSSSSWHTDSPSATDADLYEVRFTSTSGALDAGSEPADTWLTLSTDRIFYVEGNDLEQGILEGTVEVRLISDPTGCATETSTITIDTGAPF